MSSETFVEADIWTVAQTDQGNVVLIRPKGSDLAVPIFIGQLETQAILIGLGGVDVPRPLTHDLVLSIFRSMGAELKRIEINDLREGTFFARLVITVPPLDEETVVDARPSDAVGIAVRAGCPVFIAESVVEESGISVNLVNEAASTVGTAHETNSDSSDVAGKSLGAAVELTKTEEPSGPNAEEKKKLKAELEEAIEEEEYERAARIRDRLKELDD